MRQIALIFILGIVVSLALLSPIKSYANYNSEATWELIVISSEPVCTLSHYHMMEKYHDISEKYLDLYQLENEAYQPQCMTDFEYLPVLPGDRTDHGIDNTGEFDQQAVAHQLDDAAVVARDQRFDDFASERSHPVQGARLVRPHEAGIACHIGGGNGCKAAHNAFLGRVGIW